MIGVGFLATWTMVSNVTASVFMAIWKPFHFGNTVEVLPEKLEGRAPACLFDMPVLSEWAEPRPPVSIASQRQQRGAT